MSARITLKSLQKELTEKLNVIKEELHDVKKELEDVKGELKNFKDGPVKSDDQTDMGGTSEQIVTCYECDKSFKSKKDLKKHLKASHVRKIKFKICEESFDKNCYLEEHIREKHETEEQYQCDKCEKTFTLKWRMKKHTEGHEMVLKKCHYFNNKKSCPFEKIGCMFDHKRSGPCQYGNNCTVVLCAFQHEQKAKDSDDEEIENIEETTENLSDKELENKFEQYDGMEKFESNKVICDFFCNDNFGYHRCGIEDFEALIGLDAPNIHKEVDAEGKTKTYLPCEKCYKEYEDYATLKKHFLTKHSKDKFVECIVENCEYEAKSIDQLTMHICVNHYQLVREKMYS